MLFEVQLFLGLFWLDFWIGDQVKQLVRDVLNIWLDEVVVGVCQEVGLLVGLVWVDTLHESFLLGLDAGIIFIGVWEHIVLELKLFLDPSEFYAPFVGAL